MIVGRFLRWWAGQLAQMLPVSLRAGHERTRAALLVEETDSGATLRLRQRGRVRDLGMVEEAVSRLPALARRGLARVVVRPLADRVLLREVRLPAAAADAPRHALELNMDSYTPFRAEEVSFAFKVLPRRSSRSDLAVKLAVVPRERMERMLAPLAALQLQPTGELELADDGGSAGLVFEPTRRSPAAGTLVTGTLLALNLSLVTVLVAVPWQRQTAALDALEARVVTARAEAEAVSDVERRLEARRAGIEFLADEMSARPSMTVMLEELSRVLPDDSWLIALQVNDDEMRVQGFSSRASALIGALQRSSLLTQARFGSPIISDPATGAERFDIQANIVQPADDDVRAMRTVADKGGRE